MFILVTYHYVDCFREVLACVAVEFCHGSVFVCSKSQVRIVLGISMCYFDESIDMGILSIIIHEATSTSEQPTSHSQSVAMAQIGMSFTS